MYTAVLAAESLDVVTISHRVYIKESESGRQAKDLAESLQVAVGILRCNLIGLELFGLILHEAVHRTSQCG